MRDYDNSPKPNKFGQLPSIRGVSPFLYGELLRKLHSSSEEERRWAIRGFSMLKESPIPEVNCWPEKNCTDLQIAAAETVIGEWLDYLQNQPDSSEAKIIRALFPQGGYVARGAHQTPSHQGQHRSADPVFRKLNAWSQKVKEVLLDWDVASEPNDFADSEGRDCPLAPLDKERFHELAWTKFAEALQHVAEILAAAKTDYELVAAEQAIHPILSTLRWEAIAIALELRDPDGEPASAELIRDLADSMAPCEPTPTEAKPTGDWVSKYRRMRAAGL